MRLIILILLLKSTFSFGQEIKKNEIDEFTGDKLKISSWEKLAYTGKMNSYVRMKKVNSTFILNFKFITTNKAYSINEGEVLLLKLSDSQIIKLKNSSFETSSIGGGSVGISGSNLFGIKISCHINNETLKKLQNNLIVKMRIYQSNGYIEEDVKKKRAEKFISLLGLFDCN